MEITPFVARDLVGYSATAAAAVGFPAIVPTSALGREGKTAPSEKITVEVRTVDEIEGAIDAGAGRILLDNMAPELLKRAVALTRGRAILEASGGLQPGKLREVAESGVDFLSLGWLTHSAPAANLALEMDRIR